MLGNLTRVGKGTFVMLGKKDESDVMRAWRVQPLVLDEVSGKGVKAKYHSGTQQLG